MRRQIIVRGLPLPRPFERRNGELLQHRTHIFRDAVHLVTHVRLRSTSALNTVPKSLSVTGRVIEREDTRERDGVFTRWTHRFQIPCPGIGKKAHWGAFVEIEQNRDLVLVADPDQAASEHARLAQDDIGEWPLLECTRESDQDGVFVHVDLLKDRSFLEVLFSVASPRNTARRFNPTTPEKIMDAWAGRDSPKALDPLSYVFELVIPARNADILRSFLEDLCARIVGHAGAGQKVDLDEVLELMTFFGDAAVAGEDVFIADCE